MKVNAGADGSDGCQCYVDATEIQQGDGPECLNTCRAQFFQRVLEGSGVGGEWAEWCGSLDRGVAAQEFWSLYWCDSTFCGVAIDPDGGPGQDPSVDLIISTCHKLPLQYGSRYDEHLLSHRHVDVRQHDRANDADNNDDTAKPDASHASFIRRLRELGCDGRPGAVCDIDDIRWQHHRPGESFDRALRSRHDRPQGPGFGSSPTPLVSPPAGLAVGTTRGALTPPLRLRDRKFLPSILRPGTRSPSPPLTPLTPTYRLQPGGGGGAGGGEEVVVLGAASPFPPACSLAASKPISRNEQEPGASAPRTDWALESASLLFSKAVPIIPGSSPSGPGSSNNNNNNNTHHNHGSGRSATSTATITSSCTAESDGHGRVRGWSDVSSAMPPRRPGTSGQAPAGTERGNPHPPARRLRLSSPRSPSSPSSPSQLPPPPPLSPPPTRALPRPPSRRPHGERGSWGSWSGTATVVGSGSGSWHCGDGNADVHATAGTGTAAEETVSRPTSRESDAAAAEDVAVSSVSSLSDAGIRADAGGAASGGHERDLGQSEAGEGK
ncbi:hypothetical protein VTH06DRAFT_1815 [Thermothelomyces fergusii]